MDRRLLVLRHAEADDADTDHERPLTDRGRADACRVGTWLSRHAPDHVLCSTATRARQTLAEALPGAQAAFTRRLYEAHALDALDMLHGVPEDAACVLVVGHNPAAEELIGALTGEPGPLRPCGLAAVDVPMAWASLGRGCRLVRRIGPDAMP